jgi:site-specific recombinase XerD
MAGEELVRRQAGVPATLAQQTRDYIRGSKAANTRKAYRSDWRDFEGWCAAHNLISLPATPETVAMYISDLAATRKPSTIGRRISSISQAHKLAGHQSPTRSPVVRMALQGIRREKGTAPSVKSPLTVPDLRRMIDATPDTLKGKRDRALLLIGFTGAFRRSELVALNVDDIEHVEEGIVVTLRRSKTDQEGQGRRVAVPHGRHADTCPTLALQQWLEVAGIEEGPLFRSINRHGHVDGRLSDRGVALVVKHYAAAIGRDADDFSGHSLRAGFATEAARSGASELSIMRQTGHRSLPMVRRYIREGSMWQQHPGAKLGL